MSELQGVARLRIRPGKIEEFKRVAAKCIESVKPVVDEVVILDCYSQDRTREIAEAHGATFYQQEFLGFANRLPYANEVAMVKRWAQEYGMRWAAIEG